MGEDAFAKDASGSVAMVVGDTRTITGFVRLPRQLVERNHTMPVADRAGEGIVLAAAGPEFARKTTAGNISRNLQPRANNTIIAGLYEE